MNFKRLLLLGLCYISLQAVAQDPTFTQFYSNPVYLNPALAGSSGCPRIALNYRNQWPQLTGNYVTYAAAYDTYAKNVSGGVGIKHRWSQERIRII
jgi:type IX secretion system PorP/SprF family membrane protein